MKRYKYNETALTNNDSISYYLLGCYLTDGNVNTQSVFEITSKDKDWLEILTKQLCPDKPLETQRNCWRLRGCNQIISTWLKYNKCIPNKSLTLEFPKIHKQYLPDLIRGLIDGDGSISVNRNTVYICSASKAFIESFMDILHKEDIKHNLYTRKEKQTIIHGVIIQRKNPLYKISIYGKDCYKFLKWVYYSNEILSMPRKHLLANEIIHNFELRGLTLDNLETFDTNKNRSKYKISNHELNDLLTIWNSIPENERVQRGSKKQFYIKNISGKYDVTYHYINRLLNGKQRICVNKRHHLEQES